MLTKTTKNKYRHLELTKLPQNVGFIMDGNRRWAEKHGKDRFLGHEVGEDRLEPLIDTAIDLGIPYLSFWAFSTENWQRSQREVQVLMRIFRENLDKKVNRFHQKNVRLKIIGNLSLFPKDIYAKTQDWVEKTKNNTKITVTLALSYGGRDEITRAVNKLIFEKKRNKPMTAAEIGSQLDTAGQPDPDLIIRTGGVQRLSGYLLWQVNYAELYFTETLWPDFTPKHFLKALEDYQKRKRRFGK